MRLRRDRAANLDRVGMPLRWEAAPAARELVALLAWPLGDDELPGLPPLHPRLLPVPRAVRMTDTHGRVVGVSAVPGDPVPVGIASPESLFHLVATGPTGSGKSTVLLRLICADIHAGRPVAVIDEVATGP